jgi:hypothetical protein
MSRTIRTTLMILMIQIQTTLTDPTDPGPDRDLGFGP